MIISYKLSGKSIGALKKKGLSDKAVTELRSMVDVYFDSSETFIQRVNQLESADEIMTWEKQLLRAAKGYFRLDRWIKNKTLREWVEAIIFALVVALIWSRTGTRRNGTVTKNTQYVNFTLGRCTAAYSGVQSSREIKRIEHGRFTGRRGKRVWTIRVRV